MTEKISETKTNIIQFVKMATKSKKAKEKEKEKTKEKEETPEEICKRFGEKLPVLPKCALIDTVKYVGEKEKEMKETLSGVQYGTTFKGNAEGCGIRMCEELSDPWNIYTMFSKNLLCLDGAFDDIGSNSDEDRDFEPETNKKDAQKMFHEEEKRIKSIKLIGKKYKGIRKVYIEIRSGSGYVKFELCVDLNFYLMVFLWVYAQQYAFLNKHSGFSWDHIFNGSYEIKQYKDMAVVELNCSS
jgi:hypothetical protein